jgi:hypothetical protein
MKYTKVNRKQILSKLPRLISVRTGLQGGFAGLIFIVFATFQSANAEVKSSFPDVAKRIDWPSFMAQQDMVWTDVPKQWNESVFLGNGMLGNMLFQEINNKDNPYSTGAKNVLSLHLGRGDYYDNRPPVDGNYNTWRYRGRLPIGFFRIKSKGDITGADWRLDLWNARLVGTVETTVGTYEIEGKVHASYDSFCWKVTPSKNESVDFEWQPQKAEVFMRTAYRMAAERAEKTGTELPSFHKHFAAIPYPDAPDVSITNSEQCNFSRQVLYAEAGEQVMGWRVFEGLGRSRTLVGTVAFSKKKGAAIADAEKNLDRSIKEVGNGTYHSTHEDWWHRYYPRSFVSISDDFWEQFYWIQIYKYASVTRADGMLVDTYGPWYQPGLHPMVWSDLNVQLDYWLPAVANRLDIGASVMNRMDAGLENMIKNVPADWQNDSMNAGTIFPGDFRSPVGKIPADHITWLLHNYWLLCQYGNDQERMRDGLYPLLKRANASYIRYLEDFSQDLGDGKLHFKQSWSPEVVTGPDMNYTIALMRWSTKTLLEINEKNGLNDPKVAQWQQLLEDLVDYQVNENGLMLGREHPFDKGHRHYSHLLAFYPLNDLNSDEHYELIKRSVDTWIETSEDPTKAAGQARSVTAYSCSGAAAMYARLGEGEKAFQYLQKSMFIRIFSNTLYGEANEQLVETPLSVAASMQDMLLQSWSGRIRIMPGVPEAWDDIHFDSLLCEGGAVVSADRTDGKLIYAKIESPDISRAIEFKLPILNPEFVVGQVGHDVKSVDLMKNEAGFYHIDLPAGAYLIATDSAINTETIQPVKTPGKLKNIFGNSGRFEKVRSQFKYQHDMDTRRTVILP